MARGFRPAVDFGCAYGLLPLLVNRAWYGVAGLTPLPVGVLVAAAALVALSLGARRVAAIAAALAALAPLAGVPVLDTTDAALVWEPRRVVPMYAVPPADLSASLVPSAAAEVPERLPPVLGPVEPWLPVLPGFAV